MHLSFILLSILLLVFVPPSEQNLKLATFNIQVFGITKSKKEDVMNILANIICRFDGVFVQEIREKEGKAFKTLLKKVNELCGKTEGTRFDGITGPRKGKTLIKEQIGFFYRPHVIHLNEQVELKNVTDQFERSPDCFVITLRKTKMKIAVLAVHLDPDFVVREMEALYDVAPQCKEKGKTKNLLILGDMNADCNYLSKTRRNKLRLKTDYNYKWLVPDGLDTTVASSSCAYDRIIANGGPLLSKASDAQTFNFEEVYELNRKKAQEVSDHYPVEVVIK
ncbi:unnamed protein product [Hymenolepis diminuta]|uniref:Deoxyribonuclease n=1 Tax=Hymenolepis diminuta TaxID=6216 RepID=A0A564Y305_HYMDI|nr:unnamed protein product [Hymenolepis diminuta]